MEELGTCRLGSGEIDTNGHKDGDEGESAAAAPRSHPFFDVN